MKITTNNQLRNLIYGYELTEKEKKEFNYLNAEELNSHNFFRYKNWVYDPSEFLHTQNIKDFKDNWDGYQSDSYFSGIVIKYSEDNEKIKIGWYYE